MLSLFTKGFLGGVGRAVIVSTRFQEITGLVEQDAVLGYAESQQIVGLVESDTVAGEDAMSCCDSDDDNPANISLYRGDSHGVTITVKKKNAAGLWLPLDITGAASLLTVKLDYGDTTPAVQLTGTVTDGPAGKLDFAFAPADTQSLRPDTYVYDVQVTLVSLLVYTVVRAKLTIMDDVTRPPP